MTPMSSSQNLQPESAEDADYEDVSVPILSNRYRLLVVPQKLQGIKGPMFSKIDRTRVAARRLGSLKRFMDLPMDVVFETAMYLAPKDLLHLSRLSKQFRSMFASRSAIFVWKTAYCNVNLKCYEDLNEIQFASLLYDKFCMACGRYKTVCSTSSVIRLRLCPICRTENLVTKDDLLKQYSNAGDLIDRLPASLKNDKCFKPEAHLLIEKFLSLKKENSRNRFIANIMGHTLDRRKRQINEIRARIKWCCAPRPRSRLGGLGSDDGSTDRGRRSHRG